MASEFRVIPFAELLSEPVRNGIYKKKEFHGTGTKIVNMGELFAHPRLRPVEMRRLELTDSEADRFLLTEGDLLFARRSLVAEGAGKCSVVLELDEPTTFESSIIRARPDTERADSLYLYYFFNSMFGRQLLYSIRRQVAVSGITGGDLSRLEIPVPPLSEQRNIAIVLGALDDKIELNRRLNETLEGIARAIFKSWFVDFDPVYAKLEGRDPGLPAHIADLFPGRLVDSELGEIPEGWRIRSLDEIAKYQNGLALQKYPAEEGEVFLHRIKIRELRQGLFDGKSEKSTSDIPDECIVYDGDVLFSWSGSLLIDLWTGGTGALNQHLFKVTSDQFSRWFYYFWTKHHLVEFQRIAAGKATTMGHIKRSHLSEAKAMIPSDSLLKACDEIIESYLVARVNNRLESCTVEDMRDTLLPKLISGELRAEDPEAFLERVM